MQSSTGCLDLPFNYIYVSVPFKVPSLSQMWSADKLWLLRSTLRKSGCQAADRALSILSRLSVPYSVSDRFFLCKILKMEYSLYRLDCGYAKKLNLNDLNLTNYGVFSSHLHASLATELNFLLLLLHLQQTLIVISSIRKATFYHCLLKMEVSDMVRLVLLKFFNSCQLFSCYFLSLH